MPEPFDALEALMECLKRMEMNLLGMRQLRQYMPNGAGRKTLDSLIEEAEAKLAEIKRKVIQ